MKLNISNDILQVYKSALNRLDKMAEERYQSAIDLRLRVANMLDTIDKLENPEPPDWLSPLDTTETSSEAARMAFSRSAMSLDTETDSGDSEPSEPSDGHPEDEEENQPAPPMPEEEPEYNVYNLLEDISREFTNRRDDPYAICKNANMPTSEFDIWQALVKVINSLEALGKVGPDVGTPTDYLLMQYVTEYGELKNFKLR